MKKKDRREKEKTYVCTICGKKKKSNKPESCCSKTMVEENKGTWNA